MKKFEYKIQYLPDVRGLNALGIEGWELVCVQGALGIFKRELK